MLERDRAKLPKKRIATFDYGDAALHCPELFVPAWKELALNYWGKPVLPFLLRVHVYEDGTVTGVHTGFLLKGRKIADGKMADCDYIENDCPEQPFGRGPEAAAAAREYVERKQKEIDEWRQKQEEFYQLMSPVLSGPKRKKSK